MIPASIIEKIVRSHVAYVTVGSVLYRIESVDAAKLAGVGLAYLQGIADAVPEMESETEGTIRAESQSEEEAAKRIEDYRQRERDRAERMHRAAIATPEGQEAFMARIRGYVLAGVTGIGEPPEAVERMSEDVPGFDYHGSDWAPPDPVSTVRMVDTERPEGVPLADALAKHGEAGEWPLWAIEPQAWGILATLIAQLAGGRAAAVAPFRSGSPASTEAG